MDEIRFILLGEAIHKNMPIYNIFLSVFMFIVLGKKKIVSVPSTLHLTPWDILPISLAKDLIENCLCFGVLISYMYSMVNTVS